jgi:hypothetical protein
MAAIQKGIEVQQAEIGRQRDQLEVERRDIAKARAWDSLLAQSVPALRVLIACLVPLALCWQILRLVHREKDDPLLTEVLIGELDSPQSPLLPTRGALPILSDDRPFPKDASLAFPLGQDEC